MGKALFIIDVQNDFTEGGALGVEGGAAVAAGISKLLAEHPGRYDHVFASRDWHDASNDNGGHFATDGDPDYVVTWPQHCIAGTLGAEYHPALDTSAVDVHVRKGQGRPAYSIFEGSTPDDLTVPAALAALDVTEIDVAGLATDYCVRASALDALASGRRVRVLTDLVAGVDADSSAAALVELEAAGAELIGTSEIGTEGTDENDAADAGVADPNGDAK